MALGTGKEREKLVRFHSGDVNNIMDIRRLEAKIRSLGDETKIVIAILAKDTLSPEERASNDDRLTTLLKEIEQLEIQVDHLYDDEDYTDDYESGDSGDFDYD